MRLIISVLFFAITTMNMINAQGKALVIIDIQNDYFKDGKMPLVGSEEAAENAGKVLAYFREKGLPVIHIQHISNRPEAGFFLPGTQGVEIHKAVKPISDEKVIEKHFPNSFRETDLQAYLSANKISDLVICGMMTSMCVDATVRAAKDLGYNCELIADACAAPNIEFGGNTVDGKDVNTAIVGALNYYYAKALCASDLID